MKKRVLSLFMALALCLTLLPTAALAETADGATRNGQDGTNANDPYIVGEDTAAKDAKKNGEALGTALLGSLSTQAVHTDHALCTHTGTCSCPDDVKNKDVFTDAIALTVQNGELYIGETVAKRSGYSDDDKSYSNYYMLPAGNYYLGGNIELKELIRIEGEVNLCLNGHSITKTTDDKSDPDGVIRIAKDGTLSLCDCKGGGTITHGTDADNAKYIGRGVMVGESGKATFTMYGGEISGNYAGGTDQGQDGGGVYMSSGVFTMYGGKITDNHIQNGLNGYGGGLYLSGGTFTMYGGEISNNKTVGSNFNYPNGGGIYAAGDVAIYGGTISGNTAAQDGGGIYISNRSLTLSDKAVITKNTATSGGGGGVYYRSTSSSYKLTISDTAQITENSAVNGGGVYYTNSYSDASRYPMTVSGTAKIEKNTATGDGGGIYVEQGTVNMTGGTITENNETVSGSVKIEGNNATGDGGGVYYNDGTLNVSGSVSITGNKKGSAANNVYLPDGKTITITGALEDKASIGVTSGATTLSTLGSSVKVATGANNGYNEGNIFSDQGSDYTIKKEGDNVNLYYGLHEHYICGGDTCTGAGHTCGEGDKVTFKAWTKTGSLPTEDGCYYLTDNVTLTSEWGPAENSNRNIVLCLNGKTITAKVGTQDTASLTHDSIDIRKGVTVSMTDCVGTGKISRSTYDQRAVNVWGGTFNLYGGKITGFKADATSGGGVGIASNGIFNMYGGAITSNTSSYGGGGVHVGYFNSDAGTFNMYGGSITGNTSSGDGAGVRVSRNATMTISGNVKITGNKKDYRNSITDNNAYLPRNKTITVTGPLTGGADSIGVTTTDSLSDGCFIAVANGTDSCTLTDGELNAFSIDNSLKKYDSKRLRDNTLLFVRFVDIPMHEHALCGAHCEDGKQHASELWQPLIYYPSSQDLDCGPTEVNRSTDSRYAADNTTRVSYYSYTIPSGNYYLTEDLTLVGDGSSITGGVLMIEGDVKLCLNGKILSTTLTAYNVDVIRVDVGGSLTLCDCSTDGRGKVTSENKVYNCVQPVGGQNTGKASGKFTMYGGTLTGAYHGVALNDADSVALYGGTITGNNVGVSVSYPVTIGGTVNITGNTKDVRLLNKSTTGLIKIDPSLTQDSRIGVSSEQELSETITSIKIATGAAGTLNYNQIFTADEADKGYVITKEGTDLYLAKHTHNWSTTLSEDKATITLTCSNDDDNCPLDGKGGSVTLKAPAHTVYGDGNAVNATFEETDWAVIPNNTSDIRYWKDTISDDNYLGAGDENAPSGAGNYIATYAFSGVEAQITYTIEKADLTVTANDNTIVYGDVPTTRGVTYSGFVNGEDENTKGVLYGSLNIYFSGYSQYGNVGTYAGAICVGGLVADNYNIKTVPGTLTVEQREVTLTWDGYENRTYDDGKTVTATAGNLVNGDDVKVTVRDGGWNMAGSWVARAEGLTGEKAKNYKLPTTNLTKNYFIAPAEQTLTFDKTGDKSVTYGDTLENPATNDRQYGSDVTYSSSDETVATVDANGVVTALKVGKATITATAAAMDGKYSKATATYELTVTAKPIEVMIKSTPIYYGETPTLTPVVPDDALVNGDTVESLGLQLTTEASATSPVGSYDVSGTASNQNYAVTFKGSKLAVMKRPITVEVDAVSRAYGSDNPTFTAKWSGGQTLVNGDTVASLGLSLSAPDATETAGVGSYNVTGTASNGNYTVGINGTGKLTITPKAITVTVNEASRPYGEANPTFTATAPDGALVGSDTIESLNLTLRTDATTLSNVGPYDVTGTASNDNYTVTVDGAGKLTVKRKPVTITGITAANKEYDGTTAATAAGTAVIEGKVGSDEVSVIAGTAAFADKNVGAGKTVTFSGYSLGGAAAGNYTLSGQPANATADITAKGVTVTGVTATDRKYDGGNIHVTVGGSATVSGKISDDIVTVDMTDAEGTMADANVGNSKEVIITGVALSGMDAGNYNLIAQPTGVTVKITKADDPELAEIRISQKYTVATEQSKDIGRAGMPDDAGVLTYSKGTASKTGSVTIDSWAVDSTGKVTYRLSGGAAGDTVTLPVTIASANYADATANVKITLTNKDTPVATANDITVTYNRSAIPASAITGTASVDGTWEWKAGMAVTNVADSGSKTVVFKPTDSENYAEVEITINVTITQATPTGAPKYTAITSGGKTLDDAGLTLTGSTLSPNAGTLEWVDENGVVLPDDTAVEANKSYSWRFTPADTNYARLTGSIELYHVTYGGGGSSAPTITVPVTGSRDTVQVSASVSNGTAEVAEIERSELEKVGTDSDVTIDLSGLDKSVTGVTLPKDTIRSISESEADGVTIKLPNAELRVDQKTLASAAEQAKGDKVQLVVETDRAAKDTMTAAQKQALDGMKNAAALEAYFVSGGQRIRDFNGGEVELSIPYQASGAIRAWYLKEDGTREPVSARYDKENARLILRHFSHYVIEEVESGMGYAVCAKDDTCPLAAFADLVPTAWYHDGVHYCIENGLMQGVSATSFLPNDSTTRAQLVTILWRLEGSPETAGAASFSDIADGAWYAQAVRWAADSGVVKGYENGSFGPDDAVTREQMVTILYRYAQYKGYDVSVGEDTNILSFNDALTVRGYAIPAMQWACGSGLVTGIAQDRGMLLAPKDTTTRVQAATLMMRFYTECAK